MPNYLKRQFINFHESQMTINFWAAQTISATGDAIYQIALVWVVLDVTQSNLTAGLVAMCAYVPAIIFGVFAGALADKYNRMKLMLISNFSQAIIVSIIPLLFYFNLKIGIIVGLLAFFRASFGSLFPPAMYAIMPELFAKEKLIKINSIIATSGQFAYLIGPVIAGIFLTIISIETLFIWDAISFILAAIFFMRIPYNNLNKNPSKNSYMTEIISGLNYLKSNGSIGIIIIMTVLNNIFIMGPAIVGIPIFIKQFLKGSASEFAFVESGMALGMLCGSVFMFNFAKRFKTGHLLLLGILWDGLTYALFFWVQSISMALVLIIFHGFGIPVITVSRTTILQKHTPNSYHGRLFSLVHLAVSGMTAISVALVGFLAENIPIYTVFFLFGLGGMFTGFIGFCSKDIRSFN